MSARGTIDEAIRLAFAKALAELDAAPKALDLNRPADYRAHLVEAIDAVLDASGAIGDVGVQPVLREVASAAVTC